MALSQISGRPVDLGTSHESLFDYYRSSGYWGNEKLRERFACVLSPSAYVLSDAQQAELETLARATYRAVDTLNDRLCTIAASSHIPPKDGNFLKIGTAASRGLLRPLDQERAIPPALKVDLVKDAYGHFHIAEVDVYNPRGYGFCAFLEQSLPAPLRVKRYAGVKTLAGLLQQVSVLEWYVIVSEFERFYQQPFTLLATSLAAFGISMKVVREECLASGRAVIPDGSGVFAIPATLDCYPRVRAELLARRENGQLSFFYPPVAYLESKAFLPFLRGCEGMDGFIPETILLGKRYGCPEERIDYASPLVLKAAVSSGMKGVLFSDLDPSEFQSGLTRASAQKAPSWILQKQVAQKPESIIVFNENGERERHNYYLRVIAHVTRNGVLDVEITGRPDRKAHGAKDCIQIPTIFEQN